VDLAKRPIENKRLFLALAIALGFWISSFMVKEVNFWLSMGLAATTLTILSVLWAGLPLTRKDFTWRAIVIGVVSAVIADSSTPETTICGATPAPRNMACRAGDAEARMNRTVLIR